MTEEQQIKIQNFIKNLFSEAQSVEDVREIADYVDFVSMDYCANRECEIEPEEDDE